MVDCRVTTDGSLEYHRDYRETEIGEDNKESSVFWGCIRVLDLIKSRYHAFFSSIIKALHPISSDALNPPTVTVRSSESLEEESGEVTTDDMVRSAATFLTLFIHSLIEHCDRVPDCHPSPLHQFCSILSSPTTVVNNKVGVTIYQCRHH